MNILLGLLLTAHGFVHYSVAAGVVLLSTMALPVGGGFGPPLLGTIAGIAGTKVNAPLTWWRTHLGLGARRFLAMVWPWSFALCLAAWLLMFPGSIIIW